jgi:tyrosyl-tRNA synthetase
MIGDPSGKSSERNLLDEATLAHNQECVGKQLSQFLDFSSGAANQAVMVNNYDWMKEFSFLDFIRDVGKHLTVNYMMAKDSVKNRLSGENADGMSFTEFTYQMVQGYVFLHLYKNHDCTLQMGGSDQWGNITTGTELIRRIASGKGYALTCPLITKSDGSKFGKSEGGNVWLDPKRTSPYKFYQYWLNTSDQDAAKYIKIFTFLDKQTIDDLISQHQGQEHTKSLQKRLAQEVTTKVHGAAACSKAMEASTILFSKTAAQDINNIDEDTFLSIFEGVPIATIAKSELVTGLDIIAALAEKTGFLKSNGEARRALKENSVSVNFIKVKEGHLIESTALIHGKFILLQRGKKNKFIIQVASPSLFSRKTPKVKNIHLFKMDVF